MITPTTKFQVDVKISQVLFFFFLTEEIFKRAFLNTLGFFRKHKIFLFAHIERIISEKNPKMPGVSIIIPLKN